jgi:hypothetical protein
MHELWVILGVVALSAGLVDVFLVVLNYDETGFLATRMCRWQWYCLRSVTRRLSRRRRPFALRQVTGLNILLSVATWLGLVVLGFGFIYYGLMVGANFEYDGKGVGAGLFSALYLSAAQLSTVGTSQINPETDLLRALTIAETLCAPLLITLILTFLLGVYQVIRDLRTLSSNFSDAEHGMSDPLANLRPYFPDGQGLDGHLGAISSSFWSYADGVRMHHVAYFFQSGRDQFSLPYVLYAFGETLGALRWGLPAGSSVAHQPLLTRLISQFGRFIDYLQDQLGWAGDVPPLIAFEEFSAAHNGTAETRDQWAGRFLRLTRNLERLAKLAPANDSQEVYTRYRQWLPFAYRCERAQSAVSRDLDYQPMLGRFNRATPVQEKARADVQDVADDPIRSQAGIQNGYYT